MQKDEILLQIREMPQEQQEYIDLYNEVEITQKLFEELETRRLGFSILEASTIGDIRVVDDAYMVTKVSPRIVSIFVMTIFGFLISCVIAIVRGVSYLPITNPAELYDNNLFEPIVGVIPYADEINSKFNEKEPISTNEETALSSAFESIIVNLRSLKNEGNKKNIISITSPSPSNGKSTISTYLSESLLKVGNKVLLIDADFKRGKLNKYFDTKSITEKDFFNINEDNINNYMTNNDLYFIPRVRALSNSFQFICSPKFNEKLDFFKNYFDYIVIDTAPILSVADTSVLIEKSDFNFLVIRHAMNKINEVKKSVDLFNQINQDVDGYIYNAYAKPKSYYGYYNIYGNYQYQYYAEKYLDYSYDYKDNN